MKYWILLVAMIMGVAIKMNSQTISIKNARAMSEGTSVSVKGIVTNGAELGSIRYLQDNTAGIAAYSSKLSNVKRGDSILVTGTLKSYNNLLELDPVSSFTIINSGNTLPQPVKCTVDSLKESKEGVLIRINDVTFANAGSVFSSNTSYNFSSGGKISSIYVRSNHPLIGRIIPSGSVDLIGIVSQYSYSNPNTGYQLLCRDTNDIVESGGIKITSIISETNIQKQSITINWSTNIDGTSEIMYGSTNQLGKTLKNTNPTSSHSVTISGLNASELIYVKAFSVKSGDTAFSNIRPFITQSESTGEVRTYFNTPVDNSVSTAKKAIYVNKAIDDTLISYINRAKYSIDLSIYNFNENNIRSISTALNNAHKRGVIVRIIFDGSNSNLAIQNVDQGIKKIASPTGAQYGIMHNKFIVFDANALNPNLSYVWTGGTNLTEGQLYYDPNVVVIVQDKSLAIAYTLEFNEMFGSETSIPNMSSAKFGPFKEDNTPHKFIIGGKLVESYFSPTDGTNAKIIETIDNADDSINIMTMLVTRSDIAYALEDAVKKRGVALKVLVNHKNDCSSTFWNVISNLIGNNLRDDRAVSGIMHHKVMIVDEGTSKNPTVLVGSHNWSNSAENKNDENTLIFHDNAELSNIFYQAFNYRFNENPNLIRVQEKVCREYVSPSGKKITTSGIYYDTINSGGNNVVYELDIEVVNIDLNITFMGTAEFTSALLSNESNAKYQWLDCDDDMNILIGDTLRGYVVSETGNVAVEIKKNGCVDTSECIFVVPEYINENSNIEKINIYPNPSKGEFEIYMKSNINTEVYMQVFNTASMLVMEKKYTANKGGNIMKINTISLSSSVYYIVLTTENKRYISKLLIN